MLKRMIILLLLALLVTGCSGNTLDNGGEATLTVVEPTATTEIVEESTADDTTMDELEDMADSGNSAEVATLTCNTEGIESQSSDAEIEAMRKATIAFRSSLSGSLLAEASVCLDDERFFLWHNTPNDRDNRGGIQYGDLSDDQLALFEDLLQLFLSDTGYQKVDEVTTLAEGFLSELNSAVWSKDFYSIDMFGDPENSGSCFENGLKYSDMSEMSQANLTALMQTYVYHLETPFADLWWEDILREIDDTYFVWIDEESGELNNLSIYYYRIYNPHLWIEYNVEDSIGNAIEEGNHAHSITRIPSNLNGGDYGIFANIINNGGPRTLLEHYALVDHHALSDVDFDYELDGFLEHYH